MDSSNIKKFYLIFISFWVINFFFSIYQIIPNTDDAFYTLPAIGFFQTNEVAFHQYDYTYTFFERFPLYTLFQGIFYKIISIFLDINFYSYRLLNIFIFSGILIVSFLIFKKFFEINRINELYKVILFPVLLSISPISQTYLLSRPELLGILFILLAIYLLLKKVSFNYEASCFFLGLSTICHPAFLIFNIFIFLHLIFLKIKFNKIILCTITNIIPFIFLAVYYYIHLPESLDQFYIQAERLPYFKAWLGLIDYSFDIFFHNSLFIGAINTYYYSSTLILIILICFLLKKDFFNNIYDKKKKIIFFLFLSSLTLLILERNHTYLISTASFFIIFIIFLIPWNNIYIKNIFYQLKQSKKLISFFIISFLFIASWNLIHFTKFNIYQNKYLENTTFLKLKEKLFNQNDAMIIVTPEMTPYFIKEFNDQYNGIYKNKVFWFFPDIGRAKSNIERQNSFKLVKNITNKYKNERILWILAKKNLKNNCLTISDAIIHSKPIHIQFSKIDNIFNTKKYIVFNAKNIELLEEVC